MESRRSLDDGLPGAWTFTQLHAQAESARQQAYAPYSELAIGAALLTTSGDLYTGANVENASYSLTICAERAAVTRAVTDGNRDFAAIVVAGDNSKVKTLACCGACLQVLAEFDRGTLHVGFPSNGHLQVLRLRDLLPVQFKLRSAP